MKEIIKLGETSKILQVFIRDSSSTTGAGLTGLVYNSGSLTAYYHRDTDTTATSMTLVTMTVGTFTSLGFKEIDATNMPGWYQFCPPNAAIASGAKNVAFHLKGAANMVPLTIECQLIAFDLQSSTVTVGTNNDKTGYTVSTNSDKTGYTLSTTGQTNLLDQALSGHTSAGTVGGALNSAAATDPWGTALPGAYSSGTAGYILGTNLNATISSRLATSNVGAVWDVLTALLTTSGSVGKLIVDNLNATISSRLASSSISLSGGNVTAGTLTTAAILSIWEQLNAALTTVGTVGHTIYSNLDATISSRSTLTDTDILESDVTIGYDPGSVGDAIYASHTGIESLLTRIASTLVITGGKVDINDKTGFSLSAGTMEAIWDVLVADLTTSGSIGKRIVDNLNATVSSRLPTANITLNSGKVTVGTNEDKTNYQLAASAIQAFWDALTSALTTANSIGKLLTDNINATVSSRLAAANINLSAGAVTVGTNNDKTGYALSSAGVDSILDDSPAAELASIPGATATLRLMMQFVYEYLKNKKTVTTDTETLFKDNGSTSLGTASVSDDGTTFTKGKMS